MAERITVVISLADNAARRDFQEQVIAELLIHDSVDLTLIEELSQLAEDTTGLLCLEGIKGSMVLVTDIAPTSAHARLAEHQVRGRLGTYDDGNIILEDSEPREALSPGIYDAMRRIIFYLNIDDFSEVQDLGTAISAIQQELADQRLAESRSDFPILSGTTGDTAPTGPEIADIPASESNVRPMPRRGERENEGDASQEETEIDSLLDELDEMEL